MSSHLDQGQREPSSPDWLFGPLAFLAASQLVAGAASIFWAIAYPSDALLIFGPQALGGLLIGAGVLMFAMRLVQRTDGMTAAGSPRSLRGAVMIGAVGASALTFGWVFYALAERDHPGSVIVAASLGAASAAFETVAIWWTVKRMRLSTER